MSRHKHYSTSRQLYENINLNDSCPIHHPRIWLHHKQQIDPEIWGSHYWQYYHTMSLKYPEHPTYDQQRNMYDYLMNLYNQLPCQVCREHARDYIVKNEPKINRAILSQRDLFNFFVDFHNSVNHRNGKPMVSYEEARSMYS